VRRQGGERDEAVPGRYIYSMGYSFVLANGTVIDGRATRIGGSTCVKATGTSTVLVKYLEAFPHFSMMEDQAKLNPGQFIMIAAGALLLFVAGKPQPGDD